MRVENAIGMTVWANAVDLPQKVGDLIRVTINRVEPGKDDGGPAYPSTRPFSGIPMPDFTHSYTTGQPISPNGHQWFSPHPFSGSEATESFPGMSVRDAAALAALPTLIKDGLEHNQRMLERNFVRADQSTAAAFMPVDFDEIATKAFAAADAFIRARAR
jgi:hypothetical protein